MQCLTPINIPHPGATGAKHRIVVGCGQCPVCLGNKRNDWSFRLHQELIEAKTACFITLTIDPENMEYSEETGEQTVSKRHIQLFNKKLRDHTRRKVNVENWPPYRFYAVGEYGGQTDRPHYHIIAFNLHPETQSYINELWGKGNTMCESVTPGRIHYITKYILNKHENYEGRQSPFSLMSRRPGIGNNYFNKKAKWNIDNDYFYVINDQGYKQPLPEYYKRIFNKQKLRKRAEELKPILDKTTMETRKNHLKQGDDPADIRQLQVLDNQRKHNKIKKSGTL